MLNTSGALANVVSGSSNGANDASVFVVRANGHPGNGYQLQNRWFSPSVHSGALSAELRKTTFMPKQRDKLSNVKNADDWTLILHQLGIGAAISLFSISLIQQ